MSAKSTAKSYNFAAIRYDAPLRFIVPSRTEGESPHLTDLGAFNGRGECSCTHFQKRIEPLIKAGYTPERALAERKVKMPAWGTTPGACLSCWHLHVAKLKFVHDIIAAMLKDPAFNPNAKTQNSPPTRQ